MTTKTSRPEYKHWIAMKGRCANKRQPRYSEWGGRGVTVCPEWLLRLGWTVERALTAPVSVSHQRNARVTHCLRGHPFDAANTLTYGGSRKCRACNRSRGKAWWASQ